ncbi:DUF4870 domain-containing protein [Candidatus Micrarchaeota archaeon]|nr:DUF4870 domain-containing protein [Candidatus Micrarchaeota archaeon]
MPPKKDSVKMQSETPASSSGGIEKDSNLMATLSYIANFIGLPVSLGIYFMKKEDAYVRFHSMQATILYAASALLGIVLTVLSIVIVIVTAGVGGLVTICFIPIGLVVLLANLYAAYKAYQGERYKLPVIGDFAEKYI